LIATQEGSYGEPEHLTNDEGGSADPGARRPRTAAPGRPRVLVVDERPIVRIGVSGLVRNAGIDVVGEAAGSLAAITTAGDLDPDVILMHLESPGMAAGDVVRLLTRAAAGATVIVVTAPSDPGLLGALAAAAAGDAVFSPAIATALMRRLRLLGDRRMPELSARELEVLALVARGWDNARIAETLYLSTGTVKHHISSILVKLDVENRTQAAVRAVQHGLIGD
jgi:DNA-binding NarL/FixJ family response regulator